MPKRVRYEYDPHLDSRPFQPGEHKRIAVKVIDVRGNEVVGVRKIGRESGR